MNNKYKITIGKTISDDFLNGGSVDGYPFDITGDLKVREDLVGNQADFNQGTSDVSQVYEIVKTFEEQIAEVQSNILSASQDALLTTNYLDDNIVQGRIFSLDFILSMTANTPVYFTGKASTEKTTFLLPININPNTGYVTLNVYEGTNYTGGTERTAINRNRLSTTLPLTVVYEGATGNDKGDGLFSYLYGTESTNQNAGGGQGSTNNSLVLEPNETYLFELTSSENCLVGISGEFGEV